MSNNPQTKEQSEWWEAGRHVGFKVAFYRVNAMPDSTSLQDVRNDLSVLAGHPQHQSADVASTASVHVRRDTTSLGDNVEFENRIGDLLNKYAAR
jgi:hypothetical protein